MAIAWIEQYQSSTIGLDNKYAPPPEHLYTWQSPAVVGARCRVEQLDLVDLFPHLTFLHQGLPFVAKLYIHITILQVCVHIQGQWCFADLSPPFLYFSTLESAIFHKIVHRQVLSHLRHLLHLSCFVKFDTFCHICYMMSHVLHFVTFVTLVMSFILVICHTCHIFHFCKVYHICYVLLCFVTLVTSCHTGIVLLHLSHFFIFVTFCHV